ncbi:MAG: alanyl-tRNA editing protein [Eubacteriales bacterium]|jgi:alanyl-tRNA synthetase
MQRSETATIKLYEEDAYIKEFEAVVLSCEKENDRYLVSLDRTCFYPEGGGQPSDRGYIDNTLVFDVQERDGVVIHFTDKPLEPGSTVRGSIDWNRRFSNMQQHSGEHILSGLIAQISGYDNVGFHIGSEFVTLDFSGPLTTEQLHEAEARANDAIYKNLPVNAEYYTNEELKNFKYRSKKELKGPVRIVEIPGCDCCACCGTHVKRTGEVGSIKIIKAQNYKGGTRVFILCGARALSHFHSTLQSVDEISTLLSAKPEAVSEATAQLLEEIDDLKSHASVLRENLFHLMAEQVNHDPDDEFYSEVLKDLSADELRQYALILVQKVGTCLLFSGRKGEGYRYAVASTKQDCRTISKRINSELNGKGGGSPQLTQGAVKCEVEDIDSFIRSFSIPF